MMVLAAEIEGGRKPGTGLAWRRDLDCLQMLDNLLARLLS